MGNKPLKVKDSIIVDRLIIDCFKDSDLEVPLVEINKLKANFKEGEKYFNFKFDYLIYYNNKIFHDGLPSLYDNYISKVEQFSTQYKNKIFKIFIDFEKEFNYDEDDLEFEPIFTVIFEKLEIQSISCFYFNEADTEYMSIFFEQLYENVYFYKDTRNYDSLYFLLPNTDYFIKNENYLLYLGKEGADLSKKNNNKIVRFLSFKSPFNEIIFNTNYFIQFLKNESPRNIASQKIVDFLKFVQGISFIKYISQINLDAEDKLNFIKLQQRFYDFHNFLCSKASNIELIFVTKNPLNNDNVLNLSNLIQYIIKNSQNSPNPLGIHLIKIIKLDIDYEENDDQEENKKIIKINEKKAGNVIFILDKFIQLILNLMRSEKIFKRRKLIIEYYNVYDIKLPKFEIENSQQIEKLAKKEKNLFVNNLEEKAIEDNFSKENTIYYYHKQKLSYEWFINDIIKLKTYIIYILDMKLKSKNNLSNKLNKKEQKEIKSENIINIKKNIFSYIFQEKVNTYFLNKYSEENNLKRDELSFEKEIFE